MLAHVLHRGDLFAGRYRVERCIGSGGMGAVYEAEHVETERKIALKVLLPQALVSEGARERFQQEARVAAKIRHPNIVDVLDAGVDDITAMPYLVMELLHGEDLGSRILRTGRVTSREAVALLAQVASALDCLHDKQIVHRDLKPENLFLARGADGRRAVKLLDFGVAKVIAEGKTSAFTQDAQGTPVYMAPEQFAEQIRISPATDIYALGMLAFTLLTGGQYWAPEIERGMNVFMLARIAEGGPKEPATVRASRDGTELPAAFDEWFSTVTALTPDERYPTAGDAIDALADALRVDVRTASIDRAEPERTEPPSSRQSSAMSIHAGEALPPSAPLGPGSQSTPPILLQRAARFWKRPRIVTASVAGLAIAIGLLVAFREARHAGGQAASGLASPPETSTALRAMSSETTSSLPAPPASAEPSAGVETQSTSSEPSPSASTSSSSKPSPNRFPYRAPASSATTTRKPKYTRD